MVSVTGLLATLEPGNQEKGNPEGLENVNRDSAALASANRLCMPRKLCWAKSAVHAADTRESHALPQSSQRTLRFAAEFSNEFERGGRGGTQVRI